MKKILLLILLLAVVAMGAVPRWIDKSVDELLFSDCTEDTTMTTELNKWRTFANTRVYYDNDGYLGARSIAITSDNDTRTTTNLVKTTSIDISSYDLLNIVYKMEDTCKANAGYPDLYVYLVSSDGGMWSYYVTTRNRLYTKDNWYDVNVPIALPSTTPGVLNRAVLREVRISVQEVSGAGAVTASIGKISFKKSALSTGYFAITLDGGSSSFYTLGRPVFNRYDVKPTIYLTPNDIGTVNYMTWSQVDSLYLMGWEVGHICKTHTDLSTISNDSIVSEIREAHDSLMARGYRHRRLMAYPYGVKNRNTDTIAMQYTDIRRSLGSFLTIPGGTGWSGIYAPTGSAKYVSHGALMQQDTAIDGRWQTVKRLIDSCVTRKIISGVVLHQFRSSGSAIGTVIMDTAALDSMLFYLDSLKGEGLINFGGTGNIYTFAPDSCIVSISRTTGTITDSISTDADSMKIILYDSTASGWDTVAMSPMLKGGSVHTFTTSGWAGGEYRLREWGIANSGTIDSGLTAFTYYVIKIDTVGILNGPYLKGTIPITIDSVYCNNEPATIVSQSSTHINFTPASVLMAAKGDNAVFPLILYYAGGTYSANLYVFKNKLTTGSNNTISVSLTIGT